MKVDHHFSGSVALSGLYLHQYTEEPRLGFFPDAPFVQGGQNNRPIHVAVLNNTYIVNSSTVLTLRAGFNTFDDITPLMYAFDAHTLGFNPRLPMRFRRSDFRRSRSRATRARATRGRAGRTTTRTASTAR